MTKRGKLGVGILGVAVLLAGALYGALQVPAVQDALFTRAVEARAGHVRTALLDDDALHIVFCGTGSPLPDAERGQACIGVFAGGRFFLIDAGGGAAEKIAALQMPIGALSGVLLTHFHSDHIAGLPNIVLQSWAQGRHEPLKVYGPAGVKQVTDGFSAAYALDSVYRTAHHGAEIMPPSGARYAPQPVPLLNDFSEAVVLEEDGLKITAFRVGHAPVDPAYGYRIDYKDRSVVFSGDTVKHPNVVRHGKGAEAVVLEEDGLKITAFRVGHAPVDPAYGYRIDYKDRSVVFSGDTVKHPNVVRHGKGADVMVHEALAPHMVETLARGIEPRLPDTAQILRDTLTYHTSPVEAAEAANEAGAGLLVYSHVVPPLPNALARSIFLRGVSEVRAVNVEIGRDGLYLKLPVNSSDIQESQW